MALHRNSDKQFLKKELFYPLNEQFLLNRAGDIYFYDGMQATCKRVADTELFLDDSM